MNLLLSKCDAEQLMWATPWVELLHVPNSRFPASYVPSLVHTWLCRPCPEVQVRVNNVPTTYHLRGIVTHTVRILGVAWYGGIGVFVEQCAHSYLGA